MTPTSRAELERVAEACERRGTRCEISGRPDAYCIERFPTDPPSWCDGCTHGKIASLLRASVAAVMVEREACAKVADAEKAHYSDLPGTWTREVRLASTIAAGIRARGVP